MTKLTKNKYQKVSNHLKNKNYVKNSAKKLYFETVNRLFWSHIFNYNYVFTCICMYGCMGRLIHLLIDDHLLIHFYLLQVVCSLQFVGLCMCVRLVAFEHDTKQTACIIC